jgi:hypothetical protein
MFLELVLVRNSLHLPMLLIMCTLMAIFLYVASNLVYVAHRQINASNGRSSVVNGTALFPESFDEDEQEING